MNLMGKDLSDYGLPRPTRSTNTINNIDYIRELDYDVADLDVVVNRSEASLNAEQHQVYQTIMDDIALSRGSIFFLDAPGGTGTYF